MYAVNSDTLPPLVGDSRTRGTVKLKKQRFKTIVTKQLFSLWITDYWNGLSDDIITSKALDLSKTGSITYTTRIVNTLFNFRYYQKFSQVVELNRL